ncbi:NADH dehydrogenase subunit G [Arboricoccus pini]|uniref:NADH-quinone oxidoreductase n=1 Tax=Arboricoccus pini TaxID=1963835 RepID=A0A212PW87_9PROT|nr:NADH-quinone oxidoreductase subunit NuoG [Arboricoccus pini]SNB51240.1 NADH dehydrogenase subunit G [Arboricoccus pini]
MPKLTIDGQEVEVPPGSTVLQACEAAGREIPVFCYHPRLNIAGNCRMCLVEMEKSPKPVASCAMPAADGMVIKTDTPMVHKARKGVLEMLLINHPLDCPICDQGGECDLQDITLFYGPDHSRYQENKRPVTDKYLGPLISTHMTRCIHCTRCIRFINEVAGVEELGAVQRGEHMEITTWVEKALTSEMSGNIVDLCPVGALNSKPYEYKARTWELKKTESIDVMDAVGANIRLDSRGPEVMRVLPRLNEDVNEEWISDKTRFNYDGLKRRRLDVPMTKKEGKLQPTDWRGAFGAIREGLDGVPGQQVGFILGDLVDAETMVLVKELASALGSPNVDCRQDGAKLTSGDRASYLFNTGIGRLEESDAVLLVGANPRWEAPLVNTRLRKRYRQGGFKVGRVGPAFDLTYPVEELGAGPETLTAMIDQGLGSQIAFADVLRAASKPAMIVGPGAYARADGGAVLALAHRFAAAFNIVRPDAGWNGFNILHTAASRVGGLELGLVPGEGGLDVAGMLAAARSGEIKVLFLVGADEVDLSGLEKSFVIYVGSHGDAGAKVADVILPGAAYAEKNATYVNMEGRPQRSKLAIFPPGEAKEDWKIFRALSEVLGHTIPLNALPEVRGRMAELAPTLARIDEVVPAAWTGAIPVGGDVVNQAFAPAIEDFYLTNPIARASGILQECSRLFVDGHDVKATGTHG